MSRHVVKDMQYEFVFGWDQPLQSFYLQKHDLTISEEDEGEPDPIVARFGATKETTMYEVENLVQTARKNGLTIDYPTQVKLYGEKDDGI